MLQFKIPLWANFNIFHSVYGCKSGISSDLKVLWPLTLWETQVKVATSPARMEEGPDRLTALVGSGDRQWVVMTLGGS